MLVRVCTVCYLQQLHEIEIANILGHRSLSSDIFSSAQNVFFGQIHCDKRQQEIYGKVKDWTAP